MSDFFQDKNYNEYFEKLNSRINSEESLGSNNVRADHKRMPSKEIKAPRLRRGALVILLIAVVVCVTFISVRGCSSKEIDVEDKGMSAQAAEEASQGKKPEKITYQADSKTLQIPESNDAKTGIIVRLSDGKIIAERGANEKIYPASTLKIMTLLVAVENMKSLDDTFTMSYKITDPLYVADASVAGFKNGEKVKMRDLLYGMILPSGADAAAGLAVKIAGSEEAFVSLMNKRVKEMGLKNTHFTNVSGLFDENNYSTAYDMAVITEHAYRNELCRKVLSTYQYTTKKTPQNPEGIKLSSTLFSYMYGDEPETAEILGGKTGYVNEAGYCISTFGRANDSGEEYIVVTMGNSPTWPAFYGQIDLYKEFAK